MGTLRVGIVVSNPPFVDADGESGLDIDLMTAVAESLGDSLEFVHHADSASVLDALSTGDVDCAVGGLTATDDRAAYAPPYVITGQALAVDAARHPDIRAVADLDGLTVAVQRGSSAEQYAQSQPGSVTVQDRLQADGCDAIVALAPTLTALTKDSRDFDVVQQGLTIEHVAIAVAGHDQQMLSRVTVAQAELEDAGTLQEIRRKWLGNPYADQSLAVH
ncbi:ABC transporter substrate-binding protein [Mycobacterium sp. GA-2829]|uniref:ABC transporter substrate-binding protein n=1 Tax=Mycobacterium sp. GA-2829 TaxID=1772283 RepID=UPI00073FB957|nr:ABC transporter substrate-binding protein [Mycobacterium sp. GA-2829]KUI39800.1 ABC transporter substrate-binding protein [Mycobacterium sp. GA-2829]